MHRAETLLHILIPNLDLNDPGIDAAVQQGWIPGAPGKGNPNAAREATAAPTRPHPTPTGKDGNKSDTNLESMVRAVAQLDMDEQGNWDYHGHSSGLAFVRRMRDQLGDVMGPDPALSPLQKNRPMSQVIDSPRSMNDSPLLEFTTASSELPPKHLAQQIARHAVDDAAALLRAVHKPSFWQSFERIYSIPSDQYTNEDHKFLPLFYSALALGSLFASDEQTIDRDGYENAIQQGFGYFRSARQLMDIADCRDLTSLQAIILMILFLQSSAKLSQCYAYIGVALRSALRMGLHRSFAGTFSAYEIEMRKRVFWVIRKLDIYVGAMLGLPQTLSDDDIDQEFPVETDDEYVTRDAVLPMPEGEVSLLTAFNAHTRLVQILSKIVRKVYPTKVQSQQGFPEDKSYTVPFSVIRELENDLEIWKNSLPPILNPCPAAEKYSRIQQLLRLAYAHTQVMLYRPFLHFTALDKRSKPVDQRAYACAASYVNVARNIVHILTHMKQKGLLNGAHWFVMYTAFFSILSLVYFAAENPDNAACEAVMKDAREGRQVLASLAKRSLAADRCTQTLDLVFERLPSFLREGATYTPNSRKRQYDQVPKRPLPQQVAAQASRSHPDVSSVGRISPGVGLQRRASTFPKHGSPLPKAETKIANSPHSQSGTSSFGPHTPTTNGFEPGNQFNLSQQSGFADQQFSLPTTFANPALPDLSAMMFPTSDEPFSYPNQPLTTFENNQLFAKNHPYVTQGFSVDNVAAMGTPGRGRDDNMEAQFYSLPNYLEQGRRDQQQQRTSALGTSFPQSMNVTSNPMSFPQGSSIPNTFPVQTSTASWPNDSQEMLQDVSNVNIQDLFGGAEFNPMFMDHGFR